MFRLRLILCCLTLPIAGFAGVPAPPPLVDVHHAALRHAGLDHDAPAQWQRRVRWAAALPRLQIGGRHTFQDNFDVRFSDEVSVSGSGVVIGPRSSNLAEGNDRNMQLEIKALWQLNELIFSPDQLHISREARERRKEMRGLLREVNHHYHQWRIARSAVHRARATAELDALTGGWFSAALTQGDTK